MNNAEEHPRNEIEAGDSQEGDSYSGSNALDAWQQAAPGDFEEGNDQRNYAQANVALSGLNRRARRDRRPSQLVHQAAHNVPSVVVHQVDRIAGIDKRID